MQAIFAKLIYVILNPKLINKSKPRVNFDEPKTKFKIGEEN
jgi:hypothetical protein